MRQKNSIARKHTNAVIYLRVSTKEQAIGGFSLQNQERECKLWAERNGYNVLRIFRNDEGESAKTTKRPALEDMLRFIAKNKGLIDAVIVWKYDRFSRNIGDGGVLLNHLGLLGIDVKSATEPSDVSSSGRYIRNILLSTAQFENEQRAERTIGGMSQAVREGRWQWRAPIGYQYALDVDGRKKLVPDSKAIFVKEAFELAATGNYSQVEICRLLRKKGAKISAQMLNRMLRNPVYAGLIFKPEWHPEPVQGIHEPLVTLELFERVQRVLKGNKPGYRPRVKDDPEFPLRNFVICDWSDKRITGSRSTGRRKIRYPYYHCRVGKCGFGSIKREDLHRQFLALLVSVQPTQGAVSLFREIVRDVWQRKMGNIAQTQRRIQTEINQHAEKADRVLELLIKGTIGEQEYQRATVQAKERTEALRAELAGLRKDGPSLLGYLDYSCGKLSRLAETWESGGIEVKQRFQSLIFPNGIRHNGERFGTAETALIFKVLGQLDGEKSNLVTPTGVEPVLPP